MLRLTKPRRCAFDTEAIETLRHIFSKVCTDFAAQLVQLDGENNHVHLLVNYPPKVSVSSLVNSLKVCIQLRSPSPVVTNCFLLLEECVVVAVLLRCVLRRRAAEYH
jgi:putative transposase